MITYNHIRRMEITTDGAASKSVDYVEGECLSADAKPTAGVYNGSKLLEMDTGSLYMFDAESATWIEWAP